MYYTYAEDTEYQALKNLSVTALLQEIDRHDLSYFTRLLEPKADQESDLVNQHVIASSLFHQAINDGNVELVGALIDRGVDIEAIDGEGFSPLAIALICCKMFPKDSHFSDIALKLVAAGANILPNVPNPLKKENVSSEDLRVEPRFIARDGKSSIDLLQPYRWDIYSSEEAGKTSSGSPRPQLDKIKNSWLLGFGFSLSHPEIGKQLLSKLDDDTYRLFLSESLSPSSTYARFTVELSKDPRFEKTLKTLEPKLLSQGLLFMAEQDEPERAKMFLKAGADPNLAYGQVSGFTAMHYACKFEQRGLIEALLERGANANAEASALTPLVVALSNITDPDYFRWLVDKGFRFVGERQKRYIENVGLNGVSRFDVCLEHAIGDQEAFGEKYGIRANQSIMDTLHDIYDKLLFPVLLEEIALAKPRKKLRVESDTTRDINRLLRVPYMEIINALVGNRRSSEHPTEDRDAEDAILLFLKLHHTFNHPNIHFPLSEFEQSFSFAWHPLTQKTVTPSAANEQYTVVCLTTSEELRDESRALGHCVGKYGFDLKCSRNTGNRRPHIFSIRKNGIPISTFEVEIGKGFNPATSASISGKEERLNVAQHRGFADKPASKEARSVLSRWLEDIEQGRITLNETLGQLPANSRAYDGAITSFLKGKPYDRSFYEHCTHYGFHPATLADAEKAFEDAMRDVRRASQRMDKDRRLVYCDQETGKHHHIDHFIEGYHVTPDNKAVSYRDMSLKEWLKATDLMEPIKSNIYCAFHKIADKRQQKWDQEAERPVTGEKQDERAVRHGTSSIRHEMRTRQGSIQEESRRLWVDRANLAPEGNRPLL